MAFHHLRKKHLLCGRRLPHKYADFLAIQHPHTAASVARVFVENVAKLHGIQQSAVSDQHKDLLARFGKSFFAYKVPS